MNTPVLVAVAWPYASGSRHLGHLAGAYLPADVFARHQRMVGNEVLMVSGSDVHGTPITVRADADGVTIGDEHLPCRTVLWAAGVAGSPLGRSLGVPLDRAGRVLVEDDLSIPGCERVFVIGDMAAVRFDEGWVPGVAPAAMQMGRHAARVISADAHDRPRPPFSYRDKGSLATIGRARAVADVKGLRFGGFLAWLAWLAIHIFYLIGFRNRIFVLAGWAWHYLTFRRGARIITGLPGGK